ncbi:hypothetical protein [Listeria seeligeri]|uniref:hypothetical protein n=1 Tax=Listeria seeligeri TaxID=1640 RepID=UPI00162435A3|nr:hypothetical protein [Listeria seeligeri]MBC1423914.1 hypothetical protein [Listeria seeligeri]MBC1429920.1 hypothetical protein [Listeria seeligeri]MBC1533859.1 hypothetical protein [Listeria seeligeri]MBC1740874.1 hypothetical protein [Listeria seeligeri]MBC1746461.1 hypothetical protein [Listeria seeligeri]
MLDYILVSLSDLLDSFKENEIEEKIKSSFSCRREKDLESFLHEKAILYERSSLGRTFLFLDKVKLLEGVFSVIGFFTTAQTSYDISVLSKKRKRKVLGSAVPGRDSLKSFPAFLIGQIGRNDLYTSEDLNGKTMLNECFLQLKQVSKIIGGEHVILECREYMFKNFYEAQGFQKFVEEPTPEGLLTLYNRIKFNELHILKGQSQP